MATLNWISDNALEAEVLRILNIAKSAKEHVSKNFSKNVIDPFAALFEIAGFGIDYYAWENSETTRQAQKTLANHIGLFHQNILGSVNGWKNLKTGSVADLVSEEHKIIAEIKNKYNTISGGKLSDLYYSLEGLINPKSSVYKGYTSYYVAIIPKKSLRYDQPFTPSDKASGTKCQPNDLIREIDGASFYSIVTGDKNSLFDLFGILPKIIKKVTHGSWVTAPLELEGFFKKAFSQ
jgi:hypothetical protein